MKEFQTKKKYGQNFLTDKNLLSAICSDADICKDDEVLEIGAGLGALTEILSKKAKKVVSFEIDKDLVEPLKAKNLSNVEFIFDDILKWNNDEIEKKFVGDYKIVANLPYYITTPIIFKFLGKSKRIKSMTIMVQKEVALRMVAKKGDSDYGILSASIACLGEATITRNVGRKMFSPPPKVDSAVVKIDINKPFELQEIDKKFEFIRKIFAMRRKTISNNLSMGYKINRQELQSVFNIDELSKRAEDFSTEEIINMYYRFSALMKK